MSKSFNQVTLLGNLTRDPEVRTTPSGSNVCSFTLALNKKHKDQSGEWRESVDFIDVVAWAGLGDNIARWVTKGQSLLVSGMLQSRSWEQDGQKRNKVEVLARDVTFISGGKSGVQQNNTSINASDDTINLDEIPF